MSNVPAFRYRWFVENCSQLELPNGKTIVIDPIFRKDEAACGTEMEKGFISGFDDSVIEKCDYIFLTHIHFDHTGSLKVLQERFNCPILVNGWSAFELVKHEDLRTGCIIPMTDGCEYNFDDFRVLWKQTRHTQRIGSIHPSEDTMTEGMTMDERLYLHMGTTYHSSFIIKMNNGLSIAMDGGNFEPHLYEMEKYHPTLVLMHADRDPDVLADHAAAELTRSNAPYVYLMTQQILKDPKSTIDYVNSKLEERGVYGRLAYAPRGQWLNFGITAVTE